MCRQLFIASDNIKEKCNSSNSNSSTVVVKSKIITIIISNNSFDFSNLFQSNHLTVQSLGVPSGPALQKRRSSQSLGNIPLSLSVPSISLPDGTVRSIAKLRPLKTEWRSKVASRTFRRKK